jgi:protocatechuate 3,4-dioxygenase beta subunit
VATTTTDADGLYAFTGLRPGTYDVQVTTPAGFVVTRQDVGGDATDSDISAAGLSGHYTLASGDVLTTVDAGFFRPASLGDRLWLDADGNGRQDEGEAGIAGQTVTLIGGGADGVLGTADDTTASMTTDADGNYRFTGLVPGVQYQVVFGKPESAVFTGRDSGDDAGDSDADARGATPVVTLASDENNTSVDAGVYVPASLGDRVWEDANGNGQQDAGEAGIAGVTVSLRDAAGAVVATATTDADGLYAFTGLRPGTYDVQFDTPSGFVVTRQDVGGDATDSNIDASGLTGRYTLSSGDALTTVDAGYYRPASLGDRLWLDADGNGRQDEGEAGIAGQTVTLIGGGVDGVLGTADDTTASMSTDADGHYHFTGLTPGVPYQVVFGKPAGTLFTTRDSGDDLGDSDVDAAGKSQVVTLASGENNTRLDAGVFTPHVGIDIEKFVHGEYSVQTAGGGTEGLTPGFWKNHTGTGGASLSGWPETGLSPDMSYEALFGVDVPGLAPTLLQALGTNGGGVYALLRHSAAALLNASDPNIDFLYTRAQVIAMVQQAFATGSYDATKDLLATQNEKEADLSTPATGGTELVVTADVDADTASAAALIPVGGQAVFTYVVKNTGDFEIADVQVTDDRIPSLTFVGGDNDGDGRLDVGETWTYRAIETVQAGAQPIVNVGTVTGRDVLLGQALSDSDAAWYSTGATTPVTPPPANTGGTAGIDVEKLVHAEYYTSASGSGGEGLTPGFWKNHTGDGAAPLSGWPETGLSPAASYEALFGVDVPGSAPTLLQALGSEGGDVNALLRHSAAALLNASDPNISYLYSRDQVIAMVKQAFATGSYEATKNLFATQNELGADLSTPAAGSGSTLVVTADVDADTTATGLLVPAGGQAVYTYVLKNTGSVALDNVSVSDDHLASLSFVGGDTDGDHQLDVGETWTYTARETVPAGTQIAATATASGHSAALGSVVSDSDATWVNAPALSQSLGDRVWLDANANGVQDTGEAGVAGVTVKLFDATGTQLLATTRTDADGRYAFDGLAAGDYRVQIVKPAAYQAFTQANQSGNDAVDSDVDANGLSGIVSLAAGQAEGSVDAGFALNPVALNFNFSGSSATDGTDGNTRSFTSGGVSVTAEAFSRSANGQWSQAYVGAYAGGLGVTDASENGSGRSYTVDNAGRDNYLVFKFSQDVVVDKAFLGLVAGDSDLSAWIGSASTLPSQLSDALLAGLAREDNDGSAATRWADLNASERAGNLLVIAASVKGGKADDQFLLQQLGVTTLELLGVAGQDDASHWMV